MNSTLIRNDKIYDIEDYFVLSNDGNRYELIDGTLYSMSSPTGEHQEIVGEVYFQLRDYLKNKQCKVYLSPFDVKINKKDIVQPDLFILCDRRELQGTDNKYLEGPPDLVIEVWSESTGRYDLMGKRRKYQSAGVREYWVIMDVGFVYVYLPDDNGIYYETMYYSRNGKEIEIPIHIFEDRVKVKLGDFVHKWIE